jgi:hypothetical protein
MAEMSPLKDKARCASDGFRPSESPIMPIQRHAEFQSSYSYVVKECLAQIGSCDRSVLCQSVLLLDTTHAQRR